MEDAVPPRTVKWPFLVFDVLLVGLAVFVVATAVLPLSRWELGAVVVCMTVAAWVGVQPHLRDHAAAVKLYEQQQLASATEQLGNLRRVAEQIQAATGQWQGIQEHSKKVVETADAMAVRMQRESRAFSEFMVRADEQRLRHQDLEIEKLRRGEGELVQVLVHVLDHVFALWRAGMNSGQPHLAQQLGTFRAACLDAARRVGLVNHEAAPGDVFDPNIHRVADGPEPVAGVRIVQLVAPGVSYQGQGIRPVVVAVEAGGAVGDGVPGPAGAGASRE